jgi:uncharacterized membrane protein (UPF0182 family)
MDDVRPFPRRPQPPRRGRAGRTAPRRWRRWFLFVVIPLIIVVMAVLRFWVDLLWFEELKQRPVLVTRLQWGTTMGVVVGIVTFIVLWLNFWLARRVARNDLYVPFLAAPDSDPEAPEQPIVPHFVLRPVLLGVSAVAAIIAGLSMSAQWETVLRFIGRTDFGTTDPHFHKDASFYVFTMPFLELITHFLQVLVVGTAIAVVLAYLATGVIRYVPVPRVARPAIVHLSGLVAAFLVISAFQFRLSIWQLATSTSGYVAGAGWTAVHARIPGYWVMLVASLVLAVLVVVYARRERWRVVSAAVVGWVVASILVTGIMPALVQAVLVEPNEPSKEHQLIEGNIANTRTAFDLGDIDSQKFSDKKSLTIDQLLKTNTDTTDNIRLWSPDVLKSFVQQQQTLGRYYIFNDVDIDRYTVDKRYRQVMVGVRELDPSNGIVARSWTNQRLAYTHGLGAVAAWPNEVNGNEPQFLLKDLPPRPVDQTEIKLTRPEVYFGEAPENPAFVASRQREISRNASTSSGSDSNASDAGEVKTTKYQGKGGIKVDSLLRKLAVAAQLGDAHVLFTDQFTDETKLIFRRNVKARITELAPFLTLDNDPYAVLVDGRIKWIADAYTTSNRFPYSEPVELGESGTNRTVTSVNYVRNSVKAVVDAYDGDVTLYAMDTKDPILHAWRNIFPKLFTDKSKLPQELRTHLRYPEDLFRLQTKQWRRYHMSNAGDFYNNEDLWDVPTLSGVEMEPFYVLAKLPGESKAEMLLVRPLTPANRKNMISYMVARMDGEHYGEVTTFALSQTEQTQGPSQVQALIRQDGEIAQQVSLWQRSDNNEVIYGNLLVLPIDDSFIYAQPVYLQNSEANIPQFQKIVVVVGDKVAWGDDFADAVRNLVVKLGASAAEGSDAGRDTSAGSPQAGSGGASSGNAGAVGDLAKMDKAQLEQTLTDAADAYDKAIACQKQGDWACYGQQLDKLQGLLSGSAAADAAASSK